MAYRARDVGRLSSRRARIGVRGFHFQFKLGEAADTEGRHSGLRITDGVAPTEIVRAAHVTYCLDVTFKHVDDGFFETSRDDNVLSAAIRALDIGIFVTA